VRSKDEENKKKVGIHKKNPKGAASHVPKGGKQYAGLRTQRARPHRYSNIILIEYLHYIYSPNTSST
jgi:hypothetical protein